MQLYIFLFGPQVRAAAGEAANRLRIQKPKTRMGYLKQDSDGTTRWANSTKSIKSKNYLKDSRKHFKLDSIFDTVQSENWTCSELRSDLPD